VAKSASSTVTSRAVISSASRFTVAQVPARPPRRGEQIPDVVEHGASMSSAGTLVTGQVS
jgi:hypothetical protein